MGQKLSLRSARKPGLLPKFRDWSEARRSDQNLIARKLGVLHPEEEVGTSSPIWMG